MRAGRGERKGAVGRRPACGGQAGGSAHWEPVRGIVAAGLVALLGCGGAPGRSDRIEGGDRDARAELWFAGDVHLGAGGAGVLAPLAAAMTGAAGVINLEGPIDDRGREGVTREAGGIKLFNGTGTGAALRAAGIAAAGLANNHAGDAGPGGQATTAASLRAAGVQAFGGAAGVVTIERGGLRVALAGFDLGPGVPDDLRPRLAEARAMGDVLAVGFHTTGPPLYLPEPPLRAAAEMALEAGAAVVVAHGSHSLAGAELRGRAVVAWGLGNVVFACDCTDEREALALRVRLSRDGVEDAALVPIDAGLRGAPAAPAADPDPVLDLLQALGVPGRRGVDRLDLVP